jgi:hypothetical protein
MESGNFCLGDWEELPSSTVIACLRLVEELRAARPRPACRRRSRDGLMGIGR